MEYLHKLGGYIRITALHHDNGLDYRVQWVPARPGECSDAWFTIPADDVTAWIRDGIWIPLWPATLRVPEGM